MNNLAVILYVRLGAALGSGSSVAPVAQRDVRSNRELALMLGLLVRTTSHYSRRTPA